MAPQHPETATSTPAEVAEIRRSLARISHLFNRARQHDRIALRAGVPVNRAAVPILRQLADEGPLRPSEIAARLEVEHPHIARQVQALEKARYVDSLPDPADHRARRIRLTPVGRDAIARVERAEQEQMFQALSHWEPEDREQLAELLTRMTDDFFAALARTEDQ